jgi:hypothetical protein
MNKAVGAAFSATLSRCEILYVAGGSAILLVDLPPKKTTRYKTVILEEREHAKVSVFHSLRIDNHQASALVDLLSYLTHVSCLPSRNHRRDEDFVGLFIMR